VQDTGPAFDNDLDHNVDDIENNDCIFIVMVHLVNPHHFICTSSIVCGYLAEAFSKNFKPKGLHETMQMVSHAYEDVLSETAFNMLPQCQK
jgi:hypothetical protein